MKLLALLSLSLIATNSFAAWTGTRCSNSDGSVVWETGYDSDKINLKYSNFVEGVLNLEMEQVNVQFLREVTLKEKTFRGCGYMNSGKVFAGEVKITASDKTPDVLRSQFPQNKVQTAVICTTVVNSSAPCEDLSPLR